MRSVQIRCWVRRLKVALVVLADSSSGVHSQQPVVFVTSDFGQADLSTWARAGGATGLAAADNVCRSEAAEAGLNNAATFVAWMSDTVDDAACRARGLTGTVASGCDGGLPASAGPWVRSDGVAWAGGIDEVLGPEPILRRPILYTAFGDRVERTMFTGTLEDGTYAANETCGDWTMESGTTQAGLSHYTATFWHSNVLIPCDLFARLLCIEPRIGDPLPPETLAGRVAFTTTALGSGDIASWPEVTEAVADGLEAADLICRNEATAAGLAAPESFKAWLGSSTQSARDRFQHDGPWERLDGVKIADGFADLVSNQLDTTMELAADGTRLDGLAWTGIEFAGPVGNHCSDWSIGDSSFRGQDGFVTNTLSWQDRNSTGSPCSRANRLYCFSDVSDLLFGDGFESGSTSSWSGRR